MSMPAMPRSPTPPPKSVTDLRLAELDVKCPHGDECSDNNCFKMHPCPGRNCGCYGKLWLTWNNFKYNGTKRFKTCKLHSNANRKYNAERSRIVQQRAHEDNMARIAEMSKDEKPITTEAADAKAEELAQKALDALDGKSIKEVAEEEETVLYFGYTGRRVKEEHLRWLTRRGNGRATPILTWPGNQTISAGQATGELGFDSVELYTSTLKVNARAVESALQRRFHYLQLGVRLWRNNDKGGKYDKEKDQGKVHKVFLTFSREASEAILKDEIVVNLRV